MIQVTEINETVNVTVNETTESVSIEVPVQGGGSGAVNSVNGKDGTVTLNQDEIPDGTTYKRYSLTEKNKLASITEIFTTALKTTYDGVVSGYTALMLTGSRLITTGEITKLSNTSGTNTGDQDLTGYATETFVLENVPEVDTSLFAKQDGTILYHSMSATSAGTFSNTGNVCTGSGMALTDELVGAKIIKTNGEVGIIAAATSPNNFTTVEPFLTNSVNTSFAVKAVSFKNHSNGDQSLYDVAGVRRIKMSDSGYIDVGGAFFHRNGQVIVGSSEINNEFIIAHTLANRTIYTAATLPVFSSAYRVYASVSDALSPTYLGVLVGGGAVNCPVYWNGTNWITH